jgi:hypothetical protein
MKMALEDFLMKYEGNINPKNVRKHLNPEDSPDAYDLCQLAQDLLNKAQACGIIDMDDEEYDEFTTSRAKFIDALEDFDLYDQEGV